MTKRIAAALAIAQDATGTRWRDETTRFVLSELEKEPDEQSVLDAIRLAARELNYRLTLAAILERVVRPVRSTAIEYHGERTSMPDELRALMRKMRV